MDYVDEFIADAAELLEEFGAPTVVVAKRQGVYDVELSKAPEIISNNPMVAAMFPYDLEFVDGTKILQGDNKVYCQFKDPNFEPRSGDKFLWQGKTHQIVSSKAIAPNGRAVIYSLQSRV